MNDLPQRRPSDRTFVHVKGRRVVHEAKAESGRQLSPAKGSRTKSSFALLGDDKVAHRRDRQIDEEVHPALVHLVDGVCPLLDGAPMRIDCEQDARGKRGSVLGW